MFHGKQSGIGMDLARKTNAAPQCRVVQVLAQREAYARDQLLDLDLGAEVFLPMTLETTRHARQVTEDRRALFAGYLFLRHTEDSVPWAQIRATPGVVRVLPGRLPVAAYDGIRARADDEGLIRIERQAVVVDLLRPGDAVRIHTGPWAGFLGSVMRARGAERLRLLVGILEIDVRRDWVERVGAR